MEHRLRGSEVEFKVRWQESKRMTWEPLHHFFQRYNRPMVEYCAAKQLEPQVMSHLQQHPPEASVEVRAVEDAMDRMEDLRRICAVEAAARVEQSSGRGEDQWEDPPVDFEIPGDWCEEDPAMQQQYAVHVNSTGNQVWPSRC